MYVYMWGEGYNDKYVPTHPVKKLYFRIVQIIQVAH